MLPLPSIYLNGIVKYKLEEKGLSYYLNLLYEKCLGADFRGIYTLLFTRLTEGEEKHQAIHKAKVIYLAYHHDFLSSDYRTRCLFNETVIQALYSPDDTILVEEDSTKTREELFRNFIPRLDPSIYRIKGWDDPEVRKEAREHATFKIKLKQALKNIKHSSLEEFQEEEWGILLDFAEKNQNTYLLHSEVENYFSGTKPTPTQCYRFKQKLLLFLLRCKVDLEKHRMNFIYDTFEKRQDSLKTCVEKQLGKGRKVFALMGANHGDPADPRLSPIVEKHLNSLSVPFVVINLEKLIGLLNQSDEIL